MSAFLPDETRISQVHVRTGNLERALGFYTSVLGLRVVQRLRPGASLSATGSQPAIIALSEEPSATPRPRQAIGLYHFAIRYPTRRHLAQALERLLQHGYPIQGASDHLVSEAIYLSDPDDNGIELYVDRPRSRWVWHNGQIEMATEPLDLDKLLATSQGQSPPSPHVPPKTDLGHIHLHVADLAAAERFYHEFLGLAVTQRSYPGALFFSAGGYHHHVAVNTWAGELSAPPNSTGLISCRLEVPVAEILYCLQHRAPLAGYQARTLAGEHGSEMLQIRDPNGTWLELEYVPPAMQPESSENALNSKRATQNK